MNNKIFEEFFSQYKKNYMFPYFRFLYQYNSDLIKHYPFTYKRVYENNKNNFTICSNETIRICKKWL